MQVYNYDTGLTDAPNNTTKDTLIEAVRKEMQEKIKETEEVSEEPEEQEVKEEPKSGLMARKIKYDFLLGLVEGAAKAVDSQLRKDMLAHTGTY